MAKEGKPKFADGRGTTFSDNQTAGDENLRERMESCEQNRTLSERRVSPSTRNEVERLAADCLAAKNGG